MGQPENERSGVLITTTPRETDELLDRLEGDDGFRQRVEADPRAALAEYGVELGDELPDGPVSLPSAHELAEARRAMPRGQFARETSLFPTQNIFRYFRRLIFRR